MNDVHFVNQILSEKWGRCYGDRGTSMFLGDRGTSYNAPEW